MRGSGKKMPEMRRVDAAKNAGCASLRTQGVPLTLPNDLADFPAF